VDLKEQPAKAAAVFTEGPVLRHVVVMAATGAVGLLAIFFVDLANLFYISLLGQQYLAAAVGYAATIMFFTVSASIGFSIAATAITARALGAGDRLAAGKNAACSLVYVFVLNLVLVALLLPLLGPILTLLGAAGQTHAVALHFMRIVLPSTPLLGLGICLASILRARGDARRAMHVTLSAGIAAAMIDPLLIFGLKLGITGAAISIVIVRVIFVVVGFNGVWRVHRMLARPERSWLTRQMRPFLAIGVPAALTQIATPVGNAYVTGVMAGFGDDAVAGWAIVGRIVPMAFAAVFALIGAIGPIISQNLGAGRLDRVGRALRDSLMVTAVYVMVMWLVLALVREPIVAVFGAHGDAAVLIRFFCLIVAGSFLFTGALFVANAAFNNLDRPMLSTAFNWGRATIGVVPFVHFGQQFGPSGVLAGWGIGAIVFGIAAVASSFRVVGRLRATHAGHAAEAGSIVPSANLPFTSGRAAGIGWADTGERASSGTSR
jgi:putative MATE family efflux protein